MKEIKLTQGKVTLVDDEDYEYLNQWKWCIVKGNNNYNYAYNYKLGLMHRFILRTPQKLMTDHKDHDGLNNQRNNLRICTNGQNQMNKKSCGKSKYLGVWYITHKRKDKKYTYIISMIVIEGKQIYLGQFKTEEDAALAYNEAAIKYHGEFANLNVIE